MQPWWDFLKDHGLFVKWTRDNMSKHEIIEWFVEHFKGRVRAKALSKFFLLLECEESIIKKKILFGEPIFFKGFLFSKSIGNQTSILNNISWKGFPIELA